MKEFIFGILIFLSCRGWAAPTVDPLSTFFKDKTKIDKPFELRDPFKQPQFKSEKNQSKSGYSVSGKGQYTNIVENTVKSMEEIKLVGVLIGKERRAMVANGKDIIILKEGMKIGEDGAELKAILPGGIILVEKIVNVYGQEEYLETVIPISK
jgi:type IV pilus assembly protein PilP